jgi:thiol-disulfide isomerase/thioredoxin
VNQNIIEIKDLLHFLQVTQDKPKVIVDFYATWCGPCKKLEPFFDEMEKKYRGKGMTKEKPIN